MDGWLRMQWVRWRQCETVWKRWTPEWINKYYCDVTMGAMASQITSPTIVCSIVHSGPGQRNHQSSAPLAFVRGIHRWPVNSAHKWPVTRKMFLFDDVIMNNSLLIQKVIILMSYDLIYATEHQYETYQLIQLVGTQIQFNIHVIYHFQEIVPDCTRAQ